jgi:plasmid maintenance system antidote protein VapI
MLKKYIEKNNFTRSKFAELVGISDPSLDKILANKQSNILIDTAIKIYSVSGLYPWHYIAGLKHLEVIHNKGKRMENKNKRKLSTGK